MPRNLYKGVGGFTCEEDQWKIRSGAEIMDKHSRREMIKEHCRATWPSLVILIIIAGLATANLILIFTSDQPVEQMHTSNLVNGIMLAFLFIIMGFNFLYYKDHYHNMAVKYDRPDFEKQTKYAKWYIISGIFLIALHVIPRILFPQ